MACELENINVIDAGSILIVSQVCQCNEYISQFVASFYCSDHPLLLVPSIGPNARISILCHLLQADRHMHSYNLQPNVPFYSLSFS